MPGPLKLKIDEVRCDDASQGQDSKKEQSSHEALPRPAGIL